MKTFLYTNLFNLIVLLCLLVGGVFIFKKCSHQSTQNSTEINHHMLVEKIEALGKLETTKFYIKDIVEHTEHQDWLPDPKVILILSGEVAGCIDLRKLDSTDIVLEPKKVIVYLPRAEICYYKINHQQSKVYDVKNGFFREGELITKAFSRAELQIKEAALKMKILERTEANARIVLTPIFEKLAGRPVEFRNAIFIEKKPIE